MVARLPLGLAALTLAAASASAADWGYTGPWAGSSTQIQIMDELAASADGAVRLRASLGATYLQADEFVYFGDYRVSKLTWQSAAPTLRGSLSVDLGYGLSVAAEGGVALEGVSHMVDYDWLAGDDTPENWTHRSEHPDTNLAHFLTGAATIGYELAHVSDAVVRMHGGFRYTDVKWDAFGGSYVYSSGPGFRDLAGTFPPGDPAISYRQQLPEFFLGFDGEQYYGKLRVGGLMRGGLVVGAVTTDDHWMRDLRFMDNIYVQPAVELGLDAGYAFAPNAELTLAGRAKHIFEQRGDTAIFDTVSGVTLFSTNSAAASFTQLDLTAGLRAKF